MSTKGDKLSVKEQAFVLAYAASPNGTQAARAAGYKGNAATLGTAATRLLKKDKVQAALKKLSEKGTESRIATAEDRKKFWSDTMKDPALHHLVRIKASELLGKTGGDFIEKKQLTGKVIIEVKRGDA